MDFIPWLTTEWALSMFPENGPKARRANQTFVAEGIGRTRNAAFHKGKCAGLILGCDDFADRALNSIQQWRQPNGTLVDVVNAECRSYGIATQQLPAPGKSDRFTTARALAALLVQKSGHLSLTGLGPLLNRNITPLGRDAKALSELATADALEAQQHVAVRRDLEMAERRT